MEVFEDVIKKENKFNIEIKFLSVQKVQGLGA